MNHLIPIIGILSVFGTSGFILYMFIKSRNKERLALIESGRDATIFSKEHDLNQNIKWGYLALAIGLALFVGHFVEEHTTMDDGAGYFPLIFIFGGAALLLYHRRVSGEQDTI